MMYALPLLQLLLFLLAVPVLLCAGYLFALTLLSQRLRPPQAGPPRLRFDVVVPAHNEEAGIERTVRNLSALDYPAPLRRILVVADNCTDATAARARAAGATVLERTSAQLRGKGYALQHAFEHSLAEGRADAVVVVDADTLVSPGLLTAYAARLEAGAHAVQAEYGVQNPDASWRTRLLTIAFALFHDVRSRARAPGALLWPAGQRHVLQPRAAARGAARRLLRGGGRGVRPAAGPGGPPGALRRRGAGAGGDGGG